MGGMYLELWEKRIKRLVDGILKITLVLKGQGAFQKIIFYLIIFLRQMVIMTKNTLPCESQV